MLLAVFRMPAALPSAPMSSASMSYGDNRSNGSDGSDRSQWSNGPQRSNRPQRSDGSQWSDRSDCPVNICTTRKMP